MKANSPICKENGKLIETTEMLYEIDLFKGLEPTELASFFNDVELKYYPEGSIVFSPEDSSCERLYILKEGGVERYRLTEKGQAVGYQENFSGGIFGVMGLIGKEYAR